MPSKEKDTAFVKSNSLKDELKKSKFRSSESAIDKLLATFNKTIATVLADAITSAKAARRTTVLDEDAQSALDKNIGKQDLPWDDIVREVLRETPADIGKISKSIEDYIREKSK